MKNNYRITTKTIVILYALDIHRVVSCICKTVDISTTIGSIITYHHTFLADIEEVFTIVCLVVVPKLNIP